VDIDALIDRARRAAAHAYAPASGFTVGAAILSDDGRVFSGCNVENASYGLTICAERNAAFHAVAEGARAFAAIAIWTPLREPAAPCGACRQVLAEFGPRMRVVLAGSGSERVDTTLTELLPRAFSFGSFAARSDDPDSG
jgi:cytidine deaminase